MNINANEILLLNKKNMKFGLSKAPASVTAEPPVSNPESSMNALEAQGMNNITFQGVNPALLKNPALKAILALSMIAGASALTSCEKLGPTIEVNQESEQNVTIDMSAVMGMFQDMLNKMQELINSQNQANAQFAEQMKEIMTILKAMLDQQTISNNNFATIIEKLNELYLEVLSGNMSNEEFQAAMFEFMTQNNENQKMIIDILIANGKTQEEANKLLADLIAEVKAGNLSAAEAYAQILAYLKNIDANMSAVLAKFDEMLNKLDEVIAAGGSNADFAIEMKEMMNLLKQMLDQQKISNDNFSAIIKKLDDLYLQVIEGNMTNEEFQSKMFEFLTENNNNQKTIIDILIANGKTQEEANKLLADLIAEVKAGNLSAAEAYEQILAYLKNIDANVSELLKTTQTILRNMDSFFNQYMEDQKKTFEFYDSLYEQGQIQNNVLNQINENIKNMNADLSKIESAVSELLVIAKDDTKYKELIETIKGLEVNGPDYEELAELLKNLGIEIKDAINMSSQDMVKALEKFNNDYLEKEAEQTSLLVQINNKLGLLSGFPGVDQSDLADLLKGLKEAIENNTAGDKTNTDLIIKAIQEQTEALLAKLDEILNKIGDLAVEVTTSNALFAEKWDATLDKLDGLEGQLDNIEGWLKNIKAAQDVSNSYLANFEAKANEIIAEIQKLQGSGSGATGGMTLAEFAEYMTQRDADNWEKFRQFMSETGLDKMPADVTEIKDLLKALNDKLDSFKDYSAQLARIIELLEQNTDQIPDKLDQIIEILENFKCNCSCKSGNDEAVHDPDDDAEGKLEDIFG